MTTTSTPLISNFPKCLRRVPLIRAMQFSCYLSLALSLGFTNQAFAQQLTVDWKDLDGDGNDLFANDPDEFEENVDYVTEVNTYIDTVNYEANPLHGITSASYPVTGATAVPATWAPLTQVISDFGGSGIDVTMEFSPNTFDSGRTGGPNIYGSLGGTNPDSDVTGKYALRMVNDKVAAFTPFTAVITFSEPIFLDEFIVGSSSRISNHYENAVVRGFEGPHATGNTVAATTYQNISDLTDDSTLIHNLGVSASNSTNNSLDNLKIDPPSANFTYHAMGLRRCPG